MIYLRDKSIKDGGPVYWKRPAICLTKTDKIEPILKHLR